MFDEAVMISVFWLWGKTLFINIRLQTEFKDLYNKIKGIDEGWELGRYYSTFQDYGFI